MDDYEYLEPVEPDLTTSRPPPGPAKPPPGPAKPPRLHGVADPLEAGSAPHISVTAPIDTAWCEARATPSQPDKVDRLKLAGSFDSLDSETLVSVGSMPDLDSLLADLQNSIGQRDAGYESSPTVQRRTPSPAPPHTAHQTGSPKLHTEVLTETTRSNKRQLTPPPAAGSGAMGELDELLHDLGQARYTGDTFAGRRESPTAVDGGHVAVSSSALHLPGELDMVPSPNAKTYETRTVTVTESIPEGCHNTSSATQELDDLMASLSDFKIHATSYQRTVVEESHDPPYAKPVKAAQLDTMLGNLQEDMNKQGVNTTHKGTCAACDKPIAGQVITALGKTWHTEHFTCTHCNEELGTKNFFERDGRPYCEKDYHNLFSPRCAYCEGPILDKCVTALERTWHPEHFFCAHCGEPFGDSGFHERDGNAYCRTDYFSLFAPRCGACTQPVMENYISALNSQWHPHCFVCKDCQRSFENGSFFEYEGYPYCETHYHAKRGSLCAGCHKPITGRCVTAMFKKFHPEHFVCSFCLKHLNKGTFKEQADKPYCHQCFDKLFG